MSVSRAERGSRGVEELFDAFNALQWEEIADDELWYLLGFGWELLERPGAVGELLAHVAPRSFDRTDGDDIEVNSEREKFLPQEAYVELFHEGSEAREAHSLLFAVLPLDMGKNSLPAMVLQLTRRWGERKEVPEQVAEFIDEQRQVTRGGIHA